MITEICEEINNYFTADGDKHIGFFRVENGVILPSLTVPSDYFRIVGSALNDGVHRVSDNDLLDEGLFKGAVWIMKPPKAFLLLAQEIKTYVDRYEDSPYTSESFGGYSYTRDVNASGWQKTFKARLRPYRRIKL